MRSKNLIIILLLIFISSKINAQAELIDSLLHNKRRYTATRLEEDQSPKIDGLLDDECWQQGKWSGNFTQKRPNGGKPATEDTYVKVLYDYSNLYVAMICLDSQIDKMRNILAERDAWSGDVVAIAIDSYFDKRTAFEFNLTAAGQKIDLKHLGDYIEDKNWNAVWKGKTTINDTSWIAEMQIPFSQLRYAKKEEYLMGLHFSRTLGRNSEMSNWHLVPREAPARVYLFGEMDGIHDIKTSRQIEFLPYLLSSARHKGPNKAFDPLTFDAGIDAKVGISSNYTLDLTVNPDFGQVEADPSVLNLTSYETFYQEKRPFFLEGNDVFDFSIDGNSVYYSRRIGSSPDFPDTYKSINVSDKPSYTTILSSAKLVGKNNKGLSVGVLNSVTLGEYANATFPGEEATHRIPVAPVTNYFTTRIKKELREGQTIFGGALSSVNRIFNDTLTPTLVPESSQTGGLDFIQYWKKRTYYIEAKAVGSIMSGDEEAILRKQYAHNHRFQRPDATHLEIDSSARHLEGHGALIGIGKKGGNLRFDIIGQYRTPGLNLNEMGYISDADIISESSSVSYAMNKPNKVFRDYTIGLNQNAGWSFGKENTLNRTAISYSSNFNNLWRMGIKYTIKYSVLDTRALWGGPALRNNLSQDFSYSLNTNSNKDLSGSVDIGYSNSTDKIGKSFGIEGRINWLPVKRIKFNLSASYSKSKNNQQYITTIPVLNNTYYITSLIDRKIVNIVFRSDIYITPELSVRYYGSPYYSAGKYSGFKRVADAGSFNIADRFEMLDVIFNEEDDNYSYNMYGTDVTFLDPDFSFLQFRSSFVFRWEYKLGSTLYFVWTNGKTISQDSGYTIGSIVSDLFNKPCDNVFMVKFNYWFSL
ncbi:MAG TPA: DUF5916 domain-containing protein [Bacteroidales bacterium]|nr:DUF5916 domain-containing protein [Bacteroidales bacterium]